MFLKFHNVELITKNNKKGMEKVKAFSFLIYNTRVHRINPGVLSELKKQKSKKRGKAPLADIIL